MKETSKFCPRKLAYFIEPLFPTTALSTQFHCRGFPNFQFAVVFFPQKVTLCRESQAFMSAIRRLVRELKKLQQSPREDFVVSVSESNIQVWTATLFCADGSDWARGIFQLEMTFTNEYPIVPPNVKFVGKIPFHPNVSTNGKICLDILKHNWSSAYGVEAIITSIHALLVNPNPDSPVNKIAADLFSQNYREYQRAVRLCVEATWS
jgi:ubiquitin-conjugating enzyme E2 A